MYFASVLIIKSRLPLPASRPSWEKCKVDNSRRTISRSSISRSAFSALVRSTSDFHFPKAFQRWRGSGRVAQFPCPGVRSSPFLKMSTKTEQFPSSSFRLGAFKKKIVRFLRNDWFTLNSRRGEMPCSISNSRDFISRIGSRDVHHSRSPRLSVCHRSDSGSQMV